MIGHKQTQETKDKIRASLIRKGIKPPIQLFVKGHKINLGRTHSMEQKRKKSEAMLGRKITWGAKISEAKKGKKRKPFSQEAIKNMTIATRKRFANAEYRKKMAEVRPKGEAHYNWKGGASFLPYPAEFNDALKIKIRQRDEYTCQNCSMTEEEHLIVRGRVLDIHHIDYDKNNCKDENLISLCNQCNVRANYNRDYWKSIYEKHSQLRR